MDTVLLTTVHILVAAAVCWLNFITIDMFFNLPEKGGVVGASAIARHIEAGGGSREGGTMMGNIVSSPDASAGTLLAACGVFIAGIPGGLLAALLVFIGNRICHDKGYAGTTGCIIATFLVYGFTLAGFSAAEFIAGMVIAILSIQGISHAYASRVLSTIWKVRRG
jgi:energy-converting hydrogenase A subunit B